MKEVKFFLPNNYIEPIKYNSNDFLKIIIVDGSFIITSNMSRIG